MQRLRPHRRLVAAVVALPTAVALLAGCGDSLYNASYSEPVEAWQHEGAGSHGGGSTADAAAPFASGKIVNAAGAQIGTVSFAKAAAGTTVTVEAKDLTPGFHGLHVHAIGKCEPKSPDPKDPAKVGDFNSASGHLAGTGTDHPTHAGDLPVLQVGKDGTGTLTATNEHLTQELLEDADGSSLVIHGGADNYANIPTRYATAGPDAETKKAGDSGQRVACAVVEKVEATAGSGH